MDTVITSGTTPVSLATCAIGTGAVARVEARVAAHRASDGASASWHVAAAVKRVGTAQTALVGVSADVTPPSRDASASGWAVAIKASGTSAVIEVTGEAGVEWMSDVTVRELRV